MSPRRRPFLFALLLGMLASCGLDPALPAAAPRAAPALIVLPQAGGAAVLDLVASARTSLWMEMYLLTSEEAIAAVGERARAGCDVRVTLEPAPFQDEGANQGAYDRLAAAGARVRWATSRFTYTHPKAFTIDHTRLVVMTLNLTGAGLGGNREYAAIDDDPADVAAAEAILAADETGEPAGAAARIVTSPNASRATFLQLIGEAARALAIETEELTDPGIVNALLAARGRGVAVTLVWPGPAGDAGAPFATLAAAGATVRAVTAPAIHAKVTVADGRRLYVGSANFTPTSLDENREIGLLLADPAAAELVSATVADDAARGTALY